MGPRSEDVLVGALYFLKEKGKGTRFEASPQKLHRVFYDARSEALKKGATILEAFTFDTRDYFPYSEAIEDGLNALQIAGYLERENPTGMYYSIRSEAINLLFKSIQEEFDAEGIVTLKEIANSISDHLRIDA